MSQPEEPQSEEHKEYVTGDATEIPTRVQRVAAWIIEKAGRAKDVVTAGRHSFEEDDRDHFYYGPKNQ